MNRLDTPALERLLTNPPLLAVTIYAPVHTTASPPHIRENQLRLKNLIREAAEEVTRHSGSHELISRLHAWYEEMREDLNFWEDQSPALLICASEDSIETFCLPIDTEEYVALDDVYHLAPVLGLMHDAREFYVLAIAQHRPRLYAGNMYGLKPSGIELPDSIESALNIDEVNQNLENQGTATGPSSTGAGQTGSGQGWFNGRGGARDTEVAEMAHYFRIIDRLIGSHAKPERPLILAGTDDEIALFRNCTRYPAILEEAISGNRTADDLRSLFEVAQAIIWRELILPEHQAAVGEYERVGGANPDRIAISAENIVEAAQQGRVDKLLARLTTRTSDTVNDRLDDVPRLTFPTNEESKRLNEVALSVWRNRGTIYNLLPAEMPSGALMAARLRY